MANGIDDGLGDDLLRNLVGGGDLRPLRTVTGPEIDLGQDKVLGLLDELKRSSLVDLIRRDWFHIAVYAYITIQADCEDFHLQPMGAVLDAAGGLFPLVGG